MAQALSKVASAPETAIDVYEKIPHTPKRFHLEDEVPDFAIVCGGQRFLVHKKVLQKASPYFESMLRFNGKETNKKEVELHDIDVSLMHHVLDFIYTNEYILPGGIAVPTTGWCNHTSAALQDGPLKGSQIFKRKCICRGRVLCSSHLLPHIQIYAIGDYLDIFDLKLFACRGTQEVLHVYWSDEKLELADALEEAFTSTPDEDRSIRDALVGVLKEHPGLWVDEGDVHDWLSDNPKVMDEVEYI